MSRIGKLPVIIPEKVEVTMSETAVFVKGPLGSLNFNVSPLVTLKMENNTIVVIPKGDESKLMWGTTRAILNNIIVGVTDGYKRSLEVNGVGYKFELQPNKLILSIGYSHKVDMQIPAGITVSLDEKQKNLIHIFGLDKQLVGEFAAKIRAKKKPEPYKGKGIKYVGEHIRRKAGKTGK